MNSGLNDLVLGSQQTMHHMHESTVAEPRDSTREKLNLVCLSPGCEACFSAADEDLLHRHYKEAHTKRSHIASVPKHGNPYQHPNAAGNGYTAYSYIIAGSQHGHGPAYQSVSPSWSTCSQPSIALSSAARAYEQDATHDYHVAVATHHSLEPYEPLDNDGDRLSSAQKGYEQDTFRDYHVASAARPRFEPYGLLNGNGDDDTTRSPTAGIPRYVNTPDRPSAPPSPASLAPPIMTPTPGATISHASTSYDPPGPASRSSNAIQPVPTCPTCQGTFTRPGDLKRHAKSHQSGPKEFQCPVRGCKYKGSHRKDKLDGHIRCRHEGLV